MLLYSLSLSRWSYSTILADDTCNSFRFLPQIPQDIQLHVHLWGIAMPVSNPNSVLHKQWKCPVQGIDHCSWDRGSGCLEFKNSQLLCKEIGLWFSSLESL
jgi:hypothetical protein